MSPTRSPRSAQRGRSQKGRMSNQTLGIVFAVGVFVLGLSATAVFKLRGTAGATLQQHHTANTSVANTAGAGMGSQSGAPRHNSDTAHVATHAPTQAPTTTTTSKPAVVAVVGGGLAGCAAALAAQAEAAASGQALQVVLVEKMPKMGGNSAKASSGMNALSPASGDSQELFEKDTLRSGGGLSKPELVATLAARSSSAVALLGSLGVDLSKVIQLGGHSVPRTHSNPSGGNVGWSIMSKIMAAVKERGVKTMEGHQLQDVVLSAAGGVEGIKVAPSSYSAAQQAADSTESTVLAAQAVVLATGGFGANRALLAAHSPAAAALATTNGPWAQGEALDIAARAGARLRDLDQVQIHPTGFVDPADPQSGTKFLAPEKLRGVGAVMLNRDGQRFVDELSTRDKVSQKLASQPGGEAWLVMSEAAALDYGLQAIQFYCTKNLMAKVEGGAEGLARHMGVGADVVRQQLEVYNQAAGKQGEDQFGKTVFPTSIPLEGVLYAARVTPVVHYTMGGVEIDEQSRVLTLDSSTGQAGAPIAGLYAAGEVSGGVHGANRLGGNSLLECVVYGTIAGQQAARHALAAAAAATDGTTLAAAAHTNSKHQDLDSTL